MGGREAPPHFVDEAVFAYYFLLFCTYRAIILLFLFWVIFGNILKKMLKIGRGRPAGASGTGREAGPAQFSSFFSKYFRK